MKIEIDTQVLIELIKGLVEVVKAKKGVTKNVSENK